MKLQQIAVIKDNLNIPCIIYGKRFFNFYNIDFRVYYEISLFESCYSFFKGSIYK